tara:strand:- start:698 stop:2605 length:1908 start_codon:yes stop_codon:yes gene_type:complete
MLPIKQTKPYGSWPSSISAELITRAAPGISSVQCHGETLFWVESRPWEAGRSVIMCNHADGNISDLLPEPYSHTSKVHEYGGSAYTVAENTLYFVNGPDQRIYKVDITTKNPPVVMTPEGPWRFADLIVDTHNNRIIAVCEQHGEGHEPENYLASISLDNESSSVERLAWGADFYGYPRLSPDQKKLCWIQWNHPHMPWDSTQLCLASNTNVGLVGQTTVAGENLDEAIFQPQWSPDGQLYYVSDHNNWWNICRFIEGQRDIIVEADSEFATPLWQLGMSTYCFINAQTIGCIWTRNGLWHTGRIDISSRQLTTLNCHYTSMSSVCSYQGSVCMVAGAAALPAELIAIDSSSASQVIYAPASLSVDANELSEPQTILFPSAESEQVHAFFYPPTNARYCAEQSERPLVIAICHGGPTSVTGSGLNLKIQYWTNRGFAVVDINYRGSTGFGRHYRQGLTNAWGVADVEDTQYALRYLADEGKIDLDRCIIRGGSAGGYTVLSALTFTDTFKAGASLYGIGDLETLATDTHKFESRYLDSLIGPYPDRKDIYQARSPIHHADGLNCPVIFLQGLEDKVVPPNQAEMMVDILRQKGIKVAHVTFDDEGHGFRKAANIIHAMESELNFYKEVFGLEGNQ